jgi:hypothetical protein
MEMGYWTIKQHYFCPIHAKQIEWLNVDSVTVLWLYRATRKYSAVYKYRLCPCLAVSVHILVLPERR